MHWTIKFLFWPWWRAIRELKNDPASDLTTTTVVVVCTILIALSIVALKVWVSRKHSPPQFLKPATSLLLLALFVGAAGGLANMAVVEINAKGKMPNLSEYGHEDDKHYNVSDGDTITFWLSNWIDVEHHQRIGFFFPGYRYISPGDVAIAVCINSMWLIFLATLLYSILFTTRKILVI